MKNFNFSKMFNGLQKSASIHSPEILTGLGVAGVVTTVVLAVIATKPSLKQIEKEEEVKKEKLTKTEVVKVVWKNYIPTVVTGSFSIACIIGASSVNMKRNTALAAAYSLSEKAMVEYRNKVVETIGEVKEQEIREKVIQDRIDNKPISDGNIIVVGSGDIQCYDVISDRYFTSTKNKLEKIENALNRRMRDEMYISLNDYFYEVGLKNTSAGDKIGWRIEDGDIDMHFTSLLKDGDTPCLVVDFHIQPQEGYQRMY